jgi:hypothetical protein
MTFSIIKYNVSTIVYLSAVKYNKPFKSHTFFISVQFWAITEQIRAISVQTSLEFLLKQRLRGRNFKSQLTVSGLTGICQLYLSLLSSKCCRY